MYFTAFGVLQVDYLMVEVLNIEYVENVSMTPGKHKNSNKTRRYFRSIHLSPV